MHGLRDEQAIAGSPPPHRVSAGSGPRVAVVGAGISGLAAAHRIGELQPNCQLAVFEAGDRAGGLLQTVRRDGCLLEASADNFLTSLPAATNLARRIGFADELIETTEGERRAYVVSRGRLAPVPAGFSLLSPSLLWPILTTSTLSLRGKLRLAAERWIPPRRDSADESLANFARRRLGREAYERLVQPLVGGIYTADPERLSLLATLPRFARMEREHGSLTRAAGHRPPQGGNSAHIPSGARYSLFVAPRQGMESFVAAIATRLPREALRLQAPVDRLDRAADGSWRIVSAGAPPEPFAGVILATPARAAAKLLGAVDAPLSADLAGIEHASSAVVALAYERRQIGWPLHGFGFVVPACERRRILAASFASEKFPGRAPQGEVLIRVFLGGELQAELLEQSDEGLARVAVDELSDLLRTSGPPQWSEVIRWPSAMPLYHLGHLERVARIQQALDRLPGLGLAGNAYHGVGVPQCVASGEQAAERVVEHLRGGLVQ